MPSNQTDYLIQLVQSLTKSEKKAFRQFVNRESKADEKLFILLFDFIEQSKNYKEEELLAKHKQIKKSQLSNIKANLYKQILIILRHLHKSNYPDIQIRESLDFARILKSKGLTFASLELIDKARKSSDFYGQLSLLYLSKEEERKMETQYVKGSATPKAESLFSETSELISELSLQDKLANLSLRIYGKYLKDGYVKSQEQRNALEQFFESNMPKLEEKKLNGIQKVYYFQTLVWYYHLLQDFKGYYMYSQKWVNVFEENRQLIQIEPILYLKGLHNSLNALYLAEKIIPFMRRYDIFLKREENMPSQMAYDEYSTYVLIKQVHLLNGIILSGEYDEGVKKLQPLEDYLKLNTFQWDVNRIMIFYYKIACIYFGADDYDNAILYLNKITNSPIGGLREDIQCFARILNLIAHFELGNAFLVSYQIKWVYRFLEKMQDLQAVQREILSFIIKTPKITEKGLRKEFILLRDKLIILANDPIERRPFYYLDIISWLESKINNKRIQEVIREKKINR